MGGDGYGGGLDGLGGGGTTAPYVLAPSRAAVRDAVRRRLAAWRRAAPDAGDLVVTDGLASHVTAVERALRTPGGHVALIGAAGTGKKSVARLAAWAAGLPVVQLHTHAGYGAADFSADVRATPPR